MSCERLEAREVPASYFVKLHSLTTGDPFLNFPEATVSGFLDLNAAQPSVTNGGIAVDAASATDAVRHGLFGRIGVRFNGVSLFHDYTAATATTNPLQDKPFLVTTAGSPYMPTMYKVGLDDLANTNLGPNYDYNDRVWLVEADDGTSPPPPPNTVGQSPPFVPGIQLEFQDENAQGQTDGKVAKWGNAYEEEPGTPGKVRVKNNFVATEDDRYYIQIKDTNYAGQPNLTRTVRVISDSDLGNDLTVRAFPDDGGGFSGVFRSDPFVLVSNTVDDEWVVNGKADNATDDQTFRVKLGDTLTLSYTSIAVGQTIHKRVPIRVIKEAKVHITVMTQDKQGAGSNDPAKGYTAAVQVDQIMTRANETYAQVGVRLVWGTVQFADQPKKLRNDDMDVDLNNNGLLWPGYSDIEVRSMIRGNRVDNGVASSIRTAATDDVELFFVNHFANGGGVKLVGIRGISFPPAAMHLVPDAPDIVDSSIVSEDQRTVFTVTHEIGHILTNAGHYGDPPGTLTAAQIKPNLMRSLTSKEDRLDPYQETVNTTTFWTTASKRLNDDQQTRIHSERPEIVKDFIP